MSTHTSRPGLYIMVAICMLNSCDIQEACIEDNQLWQSKMAAKLDVMWLGNERGVRLKREQEDKQ